MFAHEQAVILNADNKLGKKPYDLVSIDEIEKCCATCVFQTNLITRCDSK